MQRNNILIYIQQDATLHSLFYLETCSTCFGWYHHPSSGAQTTVSTASGICHTVIAICRYRLRVGTGLIVLWVAYMLYMFRVVRPPIIRSWDSNEAVMFRIIILLDTLKKSAVSELNNVNWWDCTQCHKHSYHCVWLLTAVICVHLLLVAAFANLKLFVQMCPCA
jgi:hypothetical protein